MDPNAKAATILPSDSEGIISFVKGERQRNDQLGVNKQKQDALDRVERRKAGTAKNKYFDNLDETLPDGWVNYRPYLNSKKEALLERHATVYANYDGEIPDAERFQFERENNAFRMEADFSLEQEASLANAEKLMLEPEYNTAANKANVEYAKNPSQHASDNGLEKELEKLGPVVYARKHIYDKPLVKMNIDPMDFIKDNYWQPLKEKAIEVTSAGNTNADGSSSASGYEEFSIPKIEEFLTGTYLQDQTFGPMIDEIAGSRKIKPSELIAEMAKTIGYEKRQTSSVTKAADEDKVSYVKNGKLTDKGRGLITPQNINLGGTKGVGGQPLKVLQSIGVMSVNANVTMPSGDLAMSGGEDGKVNNRIKSTGNYTLGEGQVFISDKQGKIVFKGNATKGEGDEATIIDVFVDAERINSPAIKRAVEALKVFRDEQIATADEM